MESTRQLVADAGRRFLRPIARMMIRAGVPYRDFADIAKSAYVDVASDDYGLRGRKTNMSRVAILTGLSRKEVARVRRELDAAEPATPEGYANHASRLLAGWHQDEKFLDTAGKPMPLNTDDTHPSFADLARRYGGDMPAGALLTELRHVKAVGLDDDGRLVALKRYYMPASLDPSAIGRSASVIEDLASTVTHNLYREAKHDSRFEGRATNLRIRKGAVAAFRKLIEKEGEKLLYAMDDWLSQHEIGEDDPDSSGVRLGVGIYLIEDESNG